MINYQLHIISEDKLSIVILNAYEVFILLNYITGSRELIEEYMRKYNIQSILIYENDGNIIKYLSLKEPNINLLKHTYITILTSIEIYYILKHNIKCKEYTFEKDLNTFEHIYNIINLLEDTYICKYITKIFNIINLNLIGKSISYINLINHYLDNDESFNSIDIKECLLFCLRFKQRRSEDN